MDDKQSSNNGDEKHKQLQKTINPSNKIAVNKYFQANKAKILVHKKKIYLNKKKDSLNNKNEKSKYKSKSSIKIWNANFYQKNKIKLQVTKQKHYINKNKISSIVKTIQLANKCTKKIIKLPKIYEMKSLDLITNIRSINRQPITINLPYIGKCKFLLCI